LLTRRSTKCFVEISQSYDRSQVPKNFNTTDLQPYKALDRQIVHRDQLAHIFRWSFVLSRAKMGEKWVDFGCGSGEMLETLFRNRYQPGYYVGYDVRGSTVAAANEKFKDLKFPVEFMELDLTDPDVEAIGERFVTDVGAPDHCVTFEVVEHVGTQRVQQFLANFRAFGDDNTTYYLSTPNFDPHANQKGGAAGNHQYDSGDGRGVAIHEWDHDELNALIENSGFEIVEEFGTFASKKDYWPTLTDEDKALYDRLKRYYDANLVSNIMAPLVPARLCRNAIRVMKRS
jgi:2-polyprenyl-3-methyl-5-hydroxy-6-metoxy-1,4-benzoquinol methylase